MSYIGRDIRTGAFRQLDDISSGFDGSDTTHTMQVNSTNVSVGDVNQILLSLGGVIQKPGTDFTVSGSTLTFTTAPAANTSFFAILLGSDNGGTVTPTDGSVTGDKIASDLSIATNVTITTADNTDTLTLTSTDADASSGPNLRMYRNSSSPADSDTLGVLEYEGRNDNSEDVRYVQITSSADDVSDGTEDGSYFISTSVAGTIRNRINVRPTETVFNEESQDLDFRVETDGSAYGLFVDAGNDVIGLFNSSPSFTTGSGMHLADDVKIGFGDGGSSRPDFQLAADSSNLKLACGFGSDTADINISTGAIISTGQETAPDVGGNGLTLNQLTSDDRIMTFKSTGNVAHGRTSYAETDTFAKFSKVQSGGGLSIEAYNGTSGAYAYYLTAGASGESTAKSTSAQAMIYNACRVASGTSFLSVGANANMFVIANTSNAKFIVDAEGDIHSDGSSSISTYDKYEDAHLVRAYDLSHGKGVIDSKFDKFISYNHEKLAEMKLVGREDDGTPNHFINVTGMQRLHNGAIWQQYEKHQKLAEAVYEMAKEALGEDKADAILEKHDIKLLS